MKMNKFKLGFIIFVFALLFVFGVVFTILPFGKLKSKTGPAKTVATNTGGFKINPQMTPEDALLKIAELVRENKTAELESVLTPEIDTDIERKKLLDLLKDPNLKKMELGTSFYNNGMNDIRVTFIMADTKTFKKIFSLIIEKQSWKLDGIRDIRTLAASTYAGTAVNTDGLKINIPSSWAVTKSAQGSFYSNMQLESTDPAKLKQGQVMLQVTAVGDTKGNKLSDTINCQKFVGSKCSLVEINGREYTIIEAVIPSTTLYIGMIPIEHNNKAFLLNYFYQKGIPAETKTLLESIVSTTTF
jgi:hypothetical protein